MQLQPQQQRYNRKRRSAIKIKIRWLPELPGEHAPAIFVLLFLVAALLVLAGYRCMGGDVDAGYVVLSL